MSKAADGDVMFFIQNGYYKIQCYFKEIKLRQIASHLSARRCHACPAITVTFKSTDDSNPINLSNMFLQFRYNVPAPTLTLS
jgi:hypothetical protein